MKTASEQIQDLILLTEHENEKYKNQLVATYGMLFSKALNNVRSIIKTEYDPDNTSKKAQTALQKKINASINKDLELIHKKIMSEIDQFSWNSSVLYYDQLNAVFEPVKKFVKLQKMKKEDVISKVHSDFLVFNKGETHTITSLWAIFLAKLQSIIKQGTEQAYILDKSVEDYDSSLFGILGSTNNSKNHLSTVIATIITHGFSTALKETNLLNKAVLSGYVWQSVMDNATSDICIELNGKYWIYDAPEKSTLDYQIIPPAHHRCRSATYPITKSYTELGITADTLNDTQKQILNSTIESPITYSQFIKDQPARIQKEILGPVRYDMYKKGTITVDKFYTRDGRRLSLYELKKKGYSISSEYLQYVRRT